MGRSFLKRMLYEQTFGAIEKAKCRHFSKTEAKTEATLLKQYFSADNKLTKEEKMLVRKRWRGVMPIPISDGFPFFRGMKAIRAFDADYLPSSYYYPFILKQLNPENIKPLLVHKSMAQMIYSELIRHPHTLLRSYGRCLFDSEYRPVDISGALKILMAYEGPLLYKPAVDSNQGFGIRLYGGTEKAELLDGIKSGRILTSDFVLQEFVEQSDDTKVFNPSSLNCMRVTTICVGGEVFVGSRALKCGPVGAVVDNIGTGKRGVIVGIDKDGWLSEYGFYGNGEKTEMHNGVKFRGHRIAGFDNVLTVAKNLHSRVRQCGIVGWDIALNQGREPVLIEGNINYPGISLEQMCSGPIFGDHTDEVIDFLRFKSEKGSGTL